MTLRGGFALEVVLVGGRSWAFVRYCGELCAELVTGEG